MHVERARSYEAVIRDVTARGVRTRVLEAGPPDAPALVLVHGFLVGHLEFEGIIGPLAERFHVIAPDLPGFGESEKPGPARYPYGIDAFAEAIADVIAAFGVGRVHLLGHGMGGGVALSLAAHHPELVQRMILEDALCYPAPASGRLRLALLPVIGAIVFKQLYGRGMFRSYFRDEVFGRGASLPLDRLDRHYELFNTPSARESAYATMRALGDTRAVVARVTRVTVPTLVVWGRDDRLFPVGAAQRLAREIPGAKLEILEAGHSPHEEHPERFVELATQFLEGRR